MPKSLNEIFGKNIMFLWNRFCAKFNLSDTERGVFGLSLIFFEPIALFFLKGDLGVKISIFSYCVVSFAPLFLIFFMRAVAYIFLRITLLKRAIVKSREWRSFAEKLAKVLSWVSLKFDRFNMTMAYKIAVALIVIATSYFILTSNMEINLSWDVFVILFFSIIVAYSFAVGINQTIKIIISTYIAILTADGIGNLCERYLTNVIHPMQIEESLAVFKILAFVLSVILISIRGEFEIRIKRMASKSMTIVLNFTYGILGAGLIVSTILIYSSGASLIQETGIIMNEVVLAMYRDSSMVQAMINNYNVWFSLPAIVFVISSFIGKDNRG